MRLWNPDRKVMTAGADLNTILMTTDGVFVKEFERHKMIWLLFSGLKDRSGKDIYDGDIVKYELPNFPVFEADDIGEEFTEYIEVVEFKNGCFECDNVPTSAMNEHMEIIGNIYENQDLIK